MLIFIFFVVLVYLYWEHIKKWFIVDTSDKTSDVDEDLKDVRFEDVSSDQDDNTTPPSPVDWKRYGLEHNKKGKRATKGVHMKAAKKERDDYYDQIERLKSKRYALNDKVDDLEYDIRRTQDKERQAQILDELQRCYHDLKKIKQAFGDFYDRYEPSAGARQKYASKVSSESKEPACYERLEKKLVNIYSDFRADNPHDFTLDDCSDVVFATSQTGSEESFKEDNSKQNSVLSKIKNVVKSVAKTTTSTASQTLDKARALLGRNVPAVEIVKNKLSKESKSIFPVIS